MIACSSTAAVAASGRPWLRVGASSRGLRAARAAPSRKRGSAASLLLHGALLPAPLAVVGAMGRPGLETVASQNAPATPLARAALRQPASQPGRGRGSSNCAGRAALLVPHASASEAGMDEEDMEKKARKERKKEEKKARKAEKKARKTEMGASSGGAPPPMADVSVGAGLIEAAQKLMEAQAATHAQAHQAWQQEREIWQQKEARLLDLVDSLTARIAEMSMAAAPVSPTAAAVPQEAPAKPSAPSPPAVSADAKQKSASLLGGRGVLDIVDLIEETNRRMGEETNVAEASTEATAAALPEDPPAAPAQPPAAEPAAEGEPSEVEVVDVDTTSPVVLQYGSTDIYWVNQLQAALLRDGLYCGEEEMEEWYFGHHTQEALLTYQACNGLAETGIADMETWEKLLGPGFRKVTKEEMPLEVQQAAEQVDEEAAGDSGKPDADDLFGFLESTKAKKEEAPPSTQPPKTVTAAAGAPPAAVETRETYDKWPILRMDDGSPAVHRAQAALDQAGFDCGEDEMRWWMFGEMTQSAVHYFQACNGLPETGIIDENTWKKLLNNPDAVPSDIAGVISGNSYDEDISGDSKSTDGNGGGERIWLVGEQRWSSPL